MTPNPSFKRTATGDRRLPLNSNVRPHMKPSVRTPVPVDATQWSEKSRQSLDYTFAPAFYEDKPFTCRACGAESVFTAEQQKREFEVKKAYTWQQHVLCGSCFSKKHELLAENDAFSQRWEHEKGSNEARCGRPTPLDRTA
jgi:transcription elongation factor Elf1